MAKSPKSFPQALCAPCIRSVATSKDNPIRQPRTASVHMTGTPERALLEPGLAIGRDNLRPLSGQHITRKHSHAG